MTLRPANAIWLDGDLVEWEAANAHVLSHALNHGTGVFEGIRCYAALEGPALFRLDDHLRRLDRSGRAILMDIPFDLETLRRAVREVVSANGFRACYIRIVAFRGYGEMFLNPDPSPVSVFAAAWEQPTSFTSEGRRRGIRTTISSWRRQDGNVLPTQAKVVGAYVNLALARAEAVRAGFDEAIMLGASGNVAEATIENVFVVSSGVVSTPPVTDGALPGITRETTMTLLGDRGVACSERSLTRADLYAADEVFLTGTGAEIVPVREIDDRVLGEPGPVTLCATEAYVDATRGHDPGHTDWLDYVEGRLERGRNRTESQEATRVTVGARSRSA
jgi:branched-chain amino acid aminotransferase